MTNEQLVIRIKTGINAAENTALLYGQVKGFIRSVAWRFRGREELEDLEQECCLALYDAIEGFDPAMGYKFLTYAEYWMVQRMQRYIDSNSSIVRVPVHSRERIRRFWKLCDAFMKECGREPSDVEIAAHLGLSAGQVVQLRKDATAVRVGSLDSPVKGLESGADSTVGDMVASEEKMEEDTVERMRTAQLRAVLWNCVDALPGRQPEVIRKRYQAEMTLGAIGKEYGTTPEAVRQIHAKALRELRKPRNRKQLQPYLDDICHAGMRGTGVKRFNETWTSATERVAIQRLTD